MNDQKLINCQQCNKEFYAIPSAKRKFCSQSCSTIFNNKIGIKKYTIYCKYCGLPFIVNEREKNQKFCNLFCWYEYKKSLKTTLVCEYCKRDFKVGSTISKYRKFCSSRCFYLSRKLPSLNYSSQFDEIRPQILLRDNNSCKICGKTSNTVHHIDYNKANNLPDNLITLCLSCHMKTNFNREAWEIRFINSLNIKNINQEVYIFEGMEKSGKSTILNELSLRLNIKSYKDVFQTYGIHATKSPIWDLLLQTRQSLIIDRDFPSWWVYSKFDGRYLNESDVWRTDTIASAVNTKIIVCYKTNYEKVKYEDDVPIEANEKIFNLYKEFAKKTKCEVIFLDTTDQDLNREIGDILKIIR